jgi:hypothetical protein
MLEYLMSAPVLVKVLSTLGLILLVNGLCRQLAVSISVGALVLALWSGHPAGRMLQLAGARLFSLNNLMLLLIVFQVIWLSSQMSETGLMEELVHGVRRRVSREGAMAVLPAVIGFLPMPGGAIFSAPLVDSCDAHDNVGGLLKAQTNHWFRHVWEYWWPLYPGVLLAMELTGFDVWQMMVMGIPLTLGAIAAGFFFILRPIARREASPHAAAGRGPAGPLARPLVPIIVVILTYAIVRLGYGAVGRWSGANLPPMNRYLPMAVGLICAMLTLQRMRPLPAEAWRAILLSQRTLNLAIIVAIVRVYGAFIEADLPGGIPLVDQMRAEMAAWGIPALALIMLLPLISGLATGLSIGFVGASFPIVLSLVPHAPGSTFTTLLPTVVLAYGFGYMGMLLSPVHVCLIVTCEHFEERIMGPIIRLARPAGLMLLWALILHFVWWWVLG